MDALTLIKTRHSTRKFLRKPLHVLAAKRVAAYKANDRDS